MAKLDILIVGGGVAGPALAYWLNKAVDASITIIERAPAPRTSGQAVDIRGPAVDVIRRMGLEQAILDKNTTEKGMQFLDPQGKVKASFPATGSTSQQSLTSEFEILRGDLAQIFIDATQNAAKYVYDESVAGMEDLGTKVQVTFANNHLPSTSYDLVLVADGMISKTRRLVFGRGPNDTDYLHKLGQYMAYYTIPRIESDTTWAQWWTGGHGRVIMLRPDRYGGTRALLGVTDSDMARFEPFDKAISEGRETQMELIRKEFSGAGWQSDRCVSGLDTTDDFYYQMIAQVRMERFVKGRVGLVGDAGFCPSPISGQGTTLALVAGYVLAGELSKSSNDIPKALENYQTTLRPYVDKVQKLPPGAPQILNPQSNMGVKVFTTLISVMGSNLVTGLAKYLAPAFGGKEWQLPIYEVFQDAEASKG